MAKILINSDTSWSRELNMNFLPVAEPWKKITILRSNKTDCSTFNYVLLALHNHQAKQNSSYA